MKLTKELYEYIEKECKAFEDKTGHDVDVNDVLYTYLYSTEKDLHILNDWDEGKNNDPFWNDGLDEHSAIVFLKDMIGKIKDF